MRIFFAVSGPPCAKVASICTSNLKEGRKRFLGNAIKKREQSLNS